MSALARARDHYAQRFRAFAAERAEPGWLARLRAGAMAHFAERGLPSTREEEWRYTNLEPLAAVAFEAPPPDPVAISREELEAGTEAGIEHSETRWRVGRLADLLALGEEAPAPGPEEDPAPCAFPFENLNVHWSGTATVCCNDLDLRMALGQYPQRSLQELLEAPRLQMIRGRHEAGERSALTLCRGCSVYRPRGR